MTTPTPAKSNTLISVVCRTTGRPELIGALRSIATQSYPALELIVVDALGSGVNPIRIEGLPETRWISDGKKHNRPEAANTGLDAASGRYLMFLDEDDWIDPDHIASLYKTLQEHPDKRAAYSSTVKTSIDGVLTDEKFDREYDRYVLMRDNYLPIHSVLFEASLVREGCHFDESLEIYEDWDFWLQVAEKTEFIHHDRVTAYYRGGGDSDTGVKDLRHKYEKSHPNALAREKVLAKWLSRWSGADINRMLGTMDQTANIQRLEGDLSNTAIRIAELDKEVHIRNIRIKDLSRSLESIRQLLHTQDQKLEDYSSQLEDLKLAYQSLHLQHEELDRGVKRVLNSYSWRLTAPLRFLKRQAGRLFLQPIKSVLANQLIKNEKLHEQVIEIRKNRPSPQHPQSDSLFFYHLDSPNDNHKLFVDKLDLSGWAFSNRSETRIRIVIDGTEYHWFVPDFSRNDVLKLFRDRPHAKKCGFDKHLQLPELASGHHHLSLLMYDEEGGRESLETDFYYYRNAELYQFWRGLMEDRFADSVAEINQDVSQLQSPPITILLVGDDETSLNRTTDSLRGQVHGDLSVLLICTEPHKDLSRWESDELISAVYTADGLATALNEAVSKPGWVMGIKAGSELSPHALLHLLQEAYRDDADIVYCDHDVFDKNIGYINPEFTFGWSPEHLLSRNYVGHTYLMAAEALKACLEFLPENLSWSYRALLEFSRFDYKITRLPEVLWSETEKTGSEYSGEIAQAEGFLGDHFPGAELDTSGCHRSIVWPLPHNESELPLVSIIVPTTGKLSLVRPCIESLLGNTTYPNFEVVILDNSRGGNQDGIAYLKGKGLCIIECDEDFNWARLNNTGAAAARGSLLLFLNDDMEFIDSGWLGELVRQAQRKEIGAVGCRLLYANETLQHAGLFMVNHGGGCRHLFHKMPQDRNVYRRLDQCAREVSANTGACLMIEREKFERLDGFDEELTIVGNDVDLCLKLLDAGYRNIWTPRATVVHHESISREETVPRENEELMWKRWGHRFTAGDNYYNPNLTLTGFDCSQEFHDYEDILPDTILNGGGVTPGLLEGVNLIGYIRADMGLGEAARSDARALQAAEIDFGIINFESGNPANMGNLQWYHKEMLTAPFGVNLMHVNGDHLSWVIKELPDHYFSNRYNIAYWAWELEHLPENWSPALENVNEIWVPSEFVNRAVSEVTDKPVVTIPHNVNLKPSLSYSREHFDIPQGKFIFLAMCDTRSIAARKNPYAAIQAFLNAFESDSNEAGLVLKVNNSTDDELTMLLDLISGRNDIVLLHNRHSREEINSLLTVVDCYVSLHRSEGFGLGPAEAMCLGKPCILTNWSGNTDYMSEENCLAVDYELIEITRDYGPYNIGQRWAEADVDQAGGFMKQLVADPGLANRIGNEAGKTILERFSPQAVGKLVAQRLAEIRNITHKGAPKFKVAQ